MIEAAFAIDTTTLPAGKPAAREDVAPGFSFAAAMSALEARAAQSLETFGAAPQQSAPGKSPAAPAPSGGSSAASARSETPQPDAGSDGQPSDAGRPAQTQAKQAAQPAQPAAAPGQGATISPATVANAAPTAAALAGRQTATQPARIETATPAKAEATKLSAPKAPRAPRAPQPATQDFAKLLAKRLDGGATKFELRLDPPELGRVEAHLKVGDRGEAVLALKFENQTALDLFARDAGALRDVLLASGFDLGGDRLAFSLAEDTAPFDAGGSEGVAAPAAEIYEPLFLAPYSRGAVDLRV